MVEQDAASVPARLAQLKRELRDMKTLLAWSPASGRPARFLHPNSAQASLRLAAVQKLAQSVGLPQLREYVIGSHVVLYAHSDTEVVLLSLKHHRQLTLELVRKLFGAAQAPFRDGLQGAVCRP